MISRLGHWTAGVALLATMLGSSAAQAQFKGGGVATGTSVIMGDRYQTLGRATNFQADLYQLIPSFGEFPMLRFSVNYRSFEVQGLNVDAKVRHLGGWAGTQLQTEAGPLGFTPYFGAQLGFVYESLNFSASGATSNSATKFATRILPGFDWALGGSGVGIYFETPFEVIFVKNALTVWNALGGVRFKL